MTIFKGVYHHVLDRFFMNKSYSSSRIQNPVSHLYFQLWITKINCHFMPLLMNQISAEVVTSDAVFELTL